MLRNTLDSGNGTHPGQIDLQVLQLRLPAIRIGGKVLLVLQIRELRKPGLDQCQVSWSQVIFSRFRIVTLLSAIQGDITRVESDAIVNAANSSLMGGGGVDGAIHLAGGPAILEECVEIVATRGPLGTGDAVATTAGNLPARHLIHTVGPIWGDTDEAGSVSLLASCYTNSLDLAAEMSCQSVAFPNISTGVYRFPIRLAAQVAVAAVQGWDGDIAEITFVCFNSENYEMYQSLLGGTVDT